MDIQKHIEQLQSQYKEKNLVIQETIGAMLTHLVCIFHQDQEFLHVGLPFFKSMKSITENYMILFNMDSHFIKYDDPEIQYLREAIVALCEIWFTTIVALKGCIDFVIAELEIKWISNTLIHFLINTGTDLTLLGYSECIC